MKKNLNQMLPTKKKKQRYLLFNYNCLKREEVLETLKEIRVLIIKKMKDHIGQENAITPFELFAFVFNVNPAEIDIYKREYWWGILKTILRDLRRENELFVINKRTCLFVLKTQEECNSFKSRLDEDIKHLHKTKINAQNWVDNQKWLNL